MTENVEITTAQEDWDDFFAPENDPQTAFDSVDSDWLELYMAGEYGGGQEHEANKPVDEQAFNYQGPLPGYVFDR